jgi:peptidoglycan/xylan/chitin deacetylase (PgdA/CDA1 family)
MVAYSKEQVKESADIDEDEISQDGLRDGERQGPRLVSQRTLVSLTFDDGSSGQYTVRSMLARHSMHATFYINSGTVGAPGIMTWDEISNLAADGNEIGGHTLDHVKLPSVGAREAQRQIAHDRQALLARGFTVTDFAYPFGDWNARIASIVRKCGYSSARRAWGLCPVSDPVVNGAGTASAVEKRPLQDLWATRTVGIRAWHSLAEIKSTITRAEAAGGGWVTLVFHRVCDDVDREGYSVRPDVLAGLLAWLERRAASGTQVRTVQDAVSEMAGAFALRRRRLRVPFAADRDLAVAS